MDPNLFEDQDYEMEKSFECPYCGEINGHLLDLSVIEQDYIEDCQVCCSPIQIHYRVKDGRLTRFEAKTLDE